jgi:hypothetical protein
VIVPVPDAYDAVKVRGHSQQAKDNVVLTHVPSGQRSTLEITGNDVDPLVGAIDTTDSNGAD